MKNTIIFLVISLPHYIFSQSIIDLNLLAGEYDSLDMYVIENLDQGPMNFMEQMTYNIEYNKSTMTGFLIDVRTGKKPFTISEVDSTYNIDITFSDEYVKKGIIEQCDKEKLRIRFEKVIEEYFIKE